MENKTLVLTLVDHPVLFWSFWLQADPGILEPCRAAPEKLLHVSYLEHPVRWPLHQLQQWVPSLQTHTKAYSLLTKFSLYISIY